jgi:hypothetical protein
LIQTKRNKAQIGKKRAQFALRLCLEVMKYFWDFYFILLLIKICKMENIIPQRLTTDNSFQRTFAGKGLYPQDKQVVHQ